MSGLIQRNSRWTINTGNGYLDALLGLVAIVTIMFITTTVLWAGAWIFT